MNPLAWLMVLIPFAAGILAFAMRVAKPRRGWFVASTLASTVVLVVAWHQPQASDSLLTLDAVAFAFLAALNVSALAAAVSAAGFFAREALMPTLDDEADLPAPSGSLSEGTYIGCALWLQSTLTLAMVSVRLELAWLALGASIVLAAPLVVYFRSTGAVAAMWRMVAFGAVGLIVALIGLIALALGHLGAPWLSLGAVFAIVGLSLLMGLPWLAQAIDESPPMTGAWLTAGLCSAAVALLARLAHVLPTSLTDGLCGLMGGILLVAAAVVACVQTTYKRLVATLGLAHMGLVVGLLPHDGSDGSAAILHHAAAIPTFTALVLLTGNLHYTFGSRQLSTVRGLGHALPITSAAWTLAVVALLAMPPFAPFFTGYMGLARLAAVAPPFTILAILAWFTIFAAAGHALLATRHGNVPKEIAATLAGGREPWLTWLPSLLLIVLSAFASLWFAFEWARPVAN